MSNWPTSGNLVGTMSVGQGEPGKSLEYEWRGTELGIRAEGEEEYQFVDLASGGVGTNGREIELQVGNGYIQWRYKGEDEWNNLISIDSLKGEQGIQGLPGEQGLPGKDGQDGKQGPQGIPGKDGKDGKQGPQGLPGRDGVDGKNGIDGVTPNIQVGTVTTLEAGQQATVTRSGDNENPVFNFGIPKGRDGVGGSGGATTDLKLTQKQIDYISANISDKSLSISALKEVEIRGEEGVGITYEDGYKIAGLDDIGYVKGQFNLTAKDNATTTGFVSIDANDKSIWKFEDVARISFFNESKVYIDSLYDAFLTTSKAHPPKEPINLFGTFPSLKNAKYVRLTIKLENKENWSLLIDDVNYNCNKNKKGTSINIPKLIINKNNLSNEIKEELSKLEDNSLLSNLDNSFKLHKDTTIVFKKNKDFASTHFRIPFMCVTNLGTIIAGCDIRYKSWNDHSLIDLGTARSEDGGKTWIDKTVAIPNPGVSNTLSRVMDGTILATKEGRVFLIGNKFNTGSTGWANVTTPNDPNWDCVLYHSDNDGRTWKFNQSLKNLLPAGQISFLGGVGSGIQMKDGTLVFPIQMSRANDKPFKCQSGIIYSKDNGVTWRMSESLVPEFTSECSIVEYPTGTIMINCRQEGQNHRSIFKTVDLGTTWEETPMNTGTQQTNACQGHMCKIKVGFDKEVVLFTNPINDGSNRQDGAYARYDRSNLSLSILQNDSKFTPIYTLYRPHSDGYSCIAFDERRNRLYVVMELEYNLVFRDITDLLPTIQLYKNLEV